MQMRYDTVSHDEHRPPTVLLVNEDPGLMEALRFRLESYGYRVHMAHDGRSAMALLVEECPDVIISSDRTLMVGGFNFVQVVQSNPRWMKAGFIFLSTQQVSPSCLSHRAMFGQRIYKPFDPEHLRQAIESGLRQRKYR